MSRTFVDEDLMSWEVFASGGDHGLAEEPKVIFHCLSDPQRRPRYHPHPGDESSAAGDIHSLPDERLREILKRSRELE